MTAYDACPECGLAYGAGEGWRTEHARYHALVASVLGALREWAGCPDYTQAGYEALKARYRAPLLHLGNTHPTDKERTAAAIGYLRVRAAHSALWAALYEQWPQWLARYPTFASWAHAHLQDYAGELSDTLYTALVAHFAGVETAEGGEL